MKFVAVKKETILFFLAAVVVLAAIYGWFKLKEDSTMVFNQQSDNDVREIDMITAQFDSHVNDGKHTETYRWDPGTIFLEKGEKVNLFISGVTGDEDHPFYIEGTDIRGIVAKGEQTKVPLQFDEKGTYRLICETHADRAHSIPMIAYIVVN